MLTVNVGACQGLGPDGTLPVHLLCKGGRWRRWIPNSPSLLPPGRHSHLGKDFLLSTGYDIGPGLLARTFLPTRARLSAFAF